MSCEVRPDRRARAGGLERVAGPAALRDPHAPGRRAGRPRRRCGRRGARDRREPPPAKAAIVIAAPAQARPPAARVVALTPPAVGVAVALAVAHTSSADGGEQQRDARDREPAAATGRRRRPPSVCAAAAGALAGRADLDGRERVRLAGDEAVVDLVGPLARRSGTRPQRGRRRACRSAWRRSVFVRVAVADRDRRRQALQRRPRRAGGSSCSRSTACPGSVPAGRRAQPDGGPTTARTRPARATSRARIGTAISKRRTAPPFLEHRSYTARAVQVPCRCARPAGGQAARLGWGRVRTWSRSSWRCRGWCGRCCGRSGVELELPARGGDRVHAVRGADLAAAGGRRRWRCGAGRSRRVAARGGAWRSGWRWCRGRSPGRSREARRAAARGDDLEPVARAGGRARRCCGSRASTTSTC